MSSTQNVAPRASSVDNSANGQACWLTSRLAIALSAAGDQ